MSDPIRSLLSTCVERNLRRKDPHVPDENHTFLGADAVAQNASASRILSWTDTGGLSHWDSDATLAPSSVFGDRLSLRTKQVMWMDNGPILAALDPTKELYIRLKFYHISAEGSPNNYVLLNSVDSAGVSRLRISLVMVGGVQNNRMVRVEWTDLDDVAHTLDVPDADAVLRNNNEHQARLFFYQDHLSVEVEGYQKPVVTVTQATRFIKSAGTPHMHYLGAEGKVYGLTGFTGCIQRIGYGNDISTRPPTPP